MEVEGNNRCEDVNTGGAPVEKCGMVLFVFRYTLYQSVSRFVELYATVMNFEISRRYWVCLQQQLIL